MTVDEWDELGLVGSFRAWKVGPRPKQIEILEAAMEHINSVSYKVSKRWVFYRLWQDGLLKGSKSQKGKKAGAYDNFKGLTSKAVHHGFWPADLLADNSRTAIKPDAGSESFEEWLSNDPIFAGADDPSPAFWRSQDVFLALAYEADAMTAQFEHYIGNLPISLWPFRGQPSNPYKYELAQFLLGRSQLWGLPVVILYFGDYDDSGEVIGEIPAYDVREWSFLDDKLDIYRVGLYPDQAQQYGIPENPDKPGEYQWEALSDDAAGEIITSAIDRFIDHGAWAEYRREFSDAYSRAWELARDDELQDLISGFNEKIKGEFTK